MPPRIRLGSGKKAMTWKQCWIIAIIANTVAIGFIWFAYVSYRAGVNSASTMDISDIVLQLALPSILAAPVVTGVTFIVLYVAFYIRWKISQMTWVGKLIAIIVAFASALAGLHVYAVITGTEQSGVLIDVVSASVILASMLFLYRFVPSIIGQDHADFKFIKPKPI